MLRTSTPRAFAAARVSGWARSPTWYPPVPALSISKRSAMLSRSTGSRKHASAVGERQMLPRHTKQIRMRSIARLLRHDDAAAPEAAAALGGHAVPALGHHRPGVLVHEARV